MLIFRWIFNSLILIVVALLTPGLSFVSYWSVLVTSLILGLLNTLVRPVLILLTLPINFLTLGLFTFFINAIIFWIASTMVKGFDVVNFASAFWGALVYSLIITLINLVTSDTPKVKKVH